MDTATVTWDVAATVITMAGAGAVIAAGANRKLTQHPEPPSVGGSVEAGSIIWKRPTALEAGADRGQEADGKRNSPASGAPRRRLIRPVGSPILIGINSVRAHRPTLAKLPSNGEVWLCRGAFAVMSASPS
jgi:hypothetical protein